MYGRLMDEVSDPVVRRVIRRLAEASQQRHLPAFKRCLSREASRGIGVGPSRRGRQPPGPAHGSRFSVNTKMPGTKAAHNAWK